MAEQRKTVGIRASHHGELEELAKLLPSTMSKLVDKAIEDFLAVRGPIYRRAAEEVGKPRNMKPRHIPK